MPKAVLPIGAFGDQKQVKKVLATVFVAVGLGGATLLLPPMHESPAVALNPPSAGGAVIRPPAPTPHPPVVVTKDSSPQDIVRAIVTQGKAAGLSEDQIKTIIATAKIESGFRPTVSGGVQAYGGPGTAADEVIGLFQEKASFGTVAERQDPNKAIARFIVRFTEAYKKYRITSDTVLAATLAQNPQLSKNHGGVGTHYYNTVKSAMSAAAVLYSQAVGTAL